MESYFEKGVYLKGTLWVKGAVHFDGDFEGEIFSSSHFVVGKAGKILGNIKTYNVTNKGFIQGNLFAENKIALMNDSRLTGDVSTYNLIVEEGGNFEGRCKMIDAPPKTVNGEMETLERPLPAPVKDAEVSNSSQLDSVRGVFNKLSKKNMAIAAGIILVVGVIWFSTREKRDNLGPLVDKGYQLISENKYSEAENIFKKALGITRTNPEIYAGLGDTYFGS